MHTKNRRNLQTRMKTITIFAALGVLTLLSPTYAGSRGNGKDKHETIESVLASLPVPEWPAQAARFVSEIKGSGQEETALAAVRYAANRHPGSVAEVVGALADALPKSAPTVAATAAKLLPQEARAIENSAVRGAPDQAERIVHAMGGTVKGGFEGSDKHPGYGKRPTTPPGRGEHKPGTIRGNRPPEPPGHVFDPYPGRDTRGRHYGCP
jgi:hypothetical protein